MLKNAISNWKSGREMRNINLKPLASSFLLWFTFAFLPYAVKGVRSVPQLKNRQTN